MNALDEKIIKFIKKHHIFTLATSAENIPYCCTCFYAFDINSCALIFTSEKQTRHYKEMLEVKYVSGAIALETNIIGKIQGIQFTGSAKLIEEDEIAPAKKIYIKRFPYALPFISSCEFWSLSLEFIKMTDNKLGFGKKLLWNKNS